MSVRSTRHRARWVVLALAVIASACGDSPAAPTPMPQMPNPPAPPAPPAPPMPVPVLTVDRILAFGDSLTEGESTGRLLGHNPATPGVMSSYPFKLQALVDTRYKSQAIQIFNGGLGGERATEALARMNTLIGDLDPQVMVLLTGVNDLNAGLSIPTIIDAVEDLIRDARARGVQVFLSTIPRQVEGGRRADSAARVDPYNAELAALALDESVELIDIHPHLTETYITPDGLHITEMGNEVLAGLYFDAIRAAFEDREEEGRGHRAKGKGQREVEGPRSEEPGSAVVREDG